MHTLASILTPASPILVVGCIPIDLYVADLAGASTDGFVNDQSNIQIANKSWFYEWMYYTTCGSDRPVSSYVLVFLLTNRKCAVVVAADDDDDAVKCQLVMP
eukprot:scaffold1221_cov207-Amphora_coffeaeformis.AAC.6